MSSPSLPTPLDQLLFEAQNSSRGRSTGSVSVARAGVIVSLTRSAVPPQKGALAVAAVGPNQAPSSNQFSPLAKAFGGAGTSTSTLITSESGGSSSFQVFLAYKPSDVVVLDISSDNPDEGRANVTRLTFTPENWDVAQTVVVTGQDDQRVDGSVNYNIVLNSSASAAQEYSRLSPILLASTNVDNDLPVLSISAPTSAALEGRDRSASLLLTLSEASYLPVLVTLATEDRTATAGSDYVSSPLKVEIASGQTQS